MSIIALLHNLLKEKLPGIHATRLRSLMAAVEAGLSGASVSITDLGRAVSGPAYIKHKIKPWIAWPVIAILTPNAWRYMAP